MAAEGLLLLLLLLALTSHLVLQLLNLQLLLLQYALHGYSLLIKLPDLLLFLPLTVLEAVRQVANLVFEIIDISPHILFRCEKVRTVTTIATTTLLVMWWLGHLWLE